MDSQIALFVEDRWVPAATLTAEAGRLRFEYLPEYVFGTPEPAPVGLRLPVTMDVVTARQTDASTPLALLWDLVPQGRGRRHIAALLRLPEQDPAQDIALAQYGAFAPIGRLRLDTAVAFYAAHAGGQEATGFSVDDMVARKDAFLDQLALHGMLSAGTPGVQGVAPKFLLTQDADDLWFPDVALPDARARRHWIVKLPRGQTPADAVILRHEAIYLEAAHRLGLRSTQGAFWRDNLLFLPRFDRRVVDGRVERIHQESLAALMELTGFGRTASMFELAEAIAGVATDPASEVAEFLLRDALNRALRNTDNHLRNTSVQRFDDGRVRLSPLYDLAPMYMDPELVTRTCHWSDGAGRVLDDWNEILDRLRVDDDIKAHAARKLAAFAEALDALPAHLRELGADAAIIDACSASTRQQAARLAEVQ